MGIKNFDKFLEASEKLTGILDNFLEPFECRTMIGREFAYYTSANVISVALFENDESEKEFDDFVTTLFPNIKVNSFLWSFLHEVGHHETEDDFEEEEWEDYVRLVSDGNISNKEYFQLPIERAATVWAGEYIQSHVEELTKLNDEITIAMIHLLETVEYNN